MFQVSWSQFKTYVNLKSLNIQYLELSDVYHLMVFDGPFSLTCQLDKTNPANSDQLDFENNFKANGNKNLWQADTDGAQIVRNKAAKKGWVFSLIPIELTTSKLNSVYAKTEDGIDRSGISYKIYDVNNNEITTIENEVNAVKTVIDFEPPYDYEVVGGEAQQKTIPSSDLRIWCIAVPDIPYGSGGSREMIGGVNFKYIDPADKIEADGRVSKYMTYSTIYHTNKLRLIFKHNAGFQHDLMIILELFRA